jgi:hypothetical protein
VVFLIMIGVRGLFADTGKVILLPSGDKVILEQVLGSGVVGKEIQAMPIADTSQYVHLQEASWTFRYTNGKKKTMFFFRFLCCIKNFMRFSLEFIEPVIVLALCYLMTIAELGKRDFVLESLQNNLSFSL